MPDKEFILDTFLAKVMLAKDPSWTRGEHHLLWGVFPVSEYPLGNAGWYDELSRAQALRVSDALKILCADFTYVWLKRVRDSFSLRGLAPHPTVVKLIEDPPLTAYYRLLPVTGQPGEVLVDSGGSRTDAVIVSQIYGSFEELINPFNVLTDRRRYKPFIARVPDGTHPLQDLVRGPRTADGRGTSLSSILANAYAPGVDFSNSFVFPLNWPVCYGDLNITVIDAFGPLLGLGAHPFGYPDALGSQFRRLSDGLESGSDLEDFIGWIVAGVSAPVRGLNALGWGLGAAADSSFFNEAFALTLWSFGEFTSNLQGRRRDVLTNFELMPDLYDLIRAFSTHRGDFGEAPDGSEFLWEEENDAVPMLLLSDSDLNFVYNEYEGFNIASANYKYSLWLNKASPGVDFSVELELAAQLFEMLMKAEGFWYAVSPMFASTGPIGDGVRAGSADISAMVELLGGASLSRLVTFLWKQAVADNFVKAFMEAHPDAGISCIYELFCWMDGSGDRALIDRILGPVADAPDEAGLYWRTGGGYWDLLFTGEGLSAEGLRDRWDDFAGVNVIIGDRCYNAQVDWRTFVTLVLGSCRSKANSVGETDWYYVEP